MIDNLDDATDATLAQDKPLTQSVARAFRDNPPLIRSWRARSSLHCDGKCFGLS